MPSRTLTPTEIEAFGAELDALHRDIVGSLGEREAAYIRRVLATVRYTEIGGRAALMLGWFPPAWLAGAGLLGFSKIVENMELGHNVMHGQYDWLNDPALRGDTYEWDNVCDGDQWRHYHNYVHHTFTNVRDVDRDIGYGALRLFPEQPWTPAALLQPVTAAVLAAFFQWGVGGHDLELELAAAGKKPWRDVAKKVPAFFKKASRQLAKDYVVFPTLAGPAFIPVLTGNATANLARNLWTFGIIFCGHFTENAETFAPEVLDGETRGQWYLRQIRGSSNLSGGEAFHFMSGNLSHQIEHHLFPDVPAVRYAEMAEKVREICARYGVPYNTGSFRKQFGSVVKRIFVHALPTKPSPSPGSARAAEGRSAALANEIAA
jgi:linoleoyl-CoA desaturase